MNTSLPIRAVLLAGLLGPPLAPAQTAPAPRPATPWINHNLVFLDPAHGGDDAGATLPNNAVEKDATLALAVRLRGLLSSSGVGVLLAREPATAAPPASDTPTPAPADQPPTPDQRAGNANHAHPFACILLHATAAGSGVNVVTSPLAASQPDDTSPSAPIPWSTAQATFAAQSDRLAAELATALSRASLPVRRLHSSVRPIDSLTCPAVAIELAPANNTSPADSGYQQRVAQAVSTALLFWRGQAESTSRSADPGTAPTTVGSAP